MSVNIISFDATLNNNLINLHWSVQNEWHVKQYIIEFTKTSLSSYFSAYDTVNAVGSTDYNLNFKSPCPCNQYYRIKVINQDGSFFYSQVVSFMIDNIIVSIFNNPASGFVLLNVDKIYPGTYCVIIDESGRVMKKLFLTNNSTPVPTGNLSSGMYVLRLVSNNQMIKNSPFIITR